MSTDDTVTAERRLELTTLGQLAGIGAALLPAAGMVVRWLSFATDSSLGQSLRVAASVPIQELAGLGAGCVIPPMIFFGLVLAIVRVRSFVRGRRDLAEPRTPATTALFLAGAGVIGTACMSAAFLVFARGFPIPLLSQLLGLGLAVGAAKYEARGKLFALGTAWPLLIALIAGSTVISIVGGGLAGVTLSEYKFARPGPVPDGRYLRLGESSDRLILRRCADEKTVAVPRDSVLVEELLVADLERRPSLWEIVTTDADLELGVQYTCRAKTR